MKKNPLYASDYAFREIYLIATAAENEDSAFDKAYNGLQGWVDCFEKATLKGIVMGGGIDDANSATKHNDIMKDAYRLEKYPPRTKRKHPPCTQRVNNSCADFYILHISQYLL